MKKSSLKALLAGTVAAGLMSTTAFAADLDVEPAKEYVEVGSFKGSILLPGTGISFKVGGYTKGDVIFNFEDHEDNETSFDTLGDQGTGGDRVRFHALQSRLNFDARTTTDLGSARAFLELDLFGGGGTESFSNSANPRLRQAFAELGIESLGGSLLVGQSWSNFGDLNSYPGGLDFAGPQSVSFLRQAQVRWTQTLSDTLRLSIAAENPEFLGDASGPDNGLDSVPDFTAALRGKHSFLGGGTFSVSGVVRFLNVDNTNNPTLSDDTAVGYGFQVGTTINLTDKTSLQAQATYGDGIGRYIFTFTPAAFEGVNGDLETIRQFGTAIGLTHKWTDKVRSTAIYGYGSNLEGALADGGPTGEGTRSTQFASLNLIYSPRGNINLGVEGTYGTEDFTDGTSAEAFRLQTSLQFTF